MLCPKCYKPLAVREGFDLGTYEAKCSLCGYEVVYNEPTYENIIEYPRLTKQTKVVCESKG